MKENRKYLKKKGYYPVINRIGSRKLGNIGFEERKDNYKIAQDSGK